MQVSAIPQGAASPDGTKVTVDIKLVSGVTHTLVLAYKELETLTTALLQLANQGYERQVAAGILPQLVAPNDPINVASYRVMREDSQVPSAIVQVLARAAPNAPRSTGAIRLDADQTEQLGRALLTMAEQLRL
jgi:hypothetical protein